MCQSIRARHITIDDALTAFCRKYGEKQIALPKELHNKRHYVMRGLSAGLTDIEIEKKYGVSSNYIYNIKTQLAKDAQERIRLRDLQQ